MSILRADLHTHSTVSDGTDTPSELVAQAARARLDVIGLADHDTFAGLAEAYAAAQHWGVELLAGMEFSTQRNGSSIHLVAYGCDPDNAALAVELDKVRASRSNRLATMVQLLTEAGLPITVADVRAQAGGSPSLGRPHIADALVARGYVANRDEAFATWLGDDCPCYVPRYEPDLIDAIGLVRAAGGVAVMAHPWARGRRSVLTEAFLTELVHDHGLDGIEVFHPEHDEHVRAELGTLAAKLELLPFGASDYHGTGKTNNPLGCETTDVAVYTEVLARIQARGGYPHGRMLG